MSAKWLFSMGMLCHLPTCNALSQIHLIKTPFLAHLPCPHVFLQLCLEKSSLHGLPMAQSKSHLGRQIHQLHQFNTNCESPMQRISQTPKHLEIGWTKNCENGQIRRPQVCKGQLDSSGAKWPDPAFWQATPNAPGPSIHFMNRFFHGRSRRAMENLQTVTMIDELMHKFLSVSLLGSGFMCFPSSMSI